MSSSNLKSRARALAENQTAALGLILGIGIVLRLILTAGTTGVLWPDSLTYFKWARQIAFHFNFSDHAPYRTPLYPIFLAFFLRLFGTSPLSGEIIIAAQRVLGLLSAVFVYKTARRIFSPSTALVSGVLYVASPLQLFYETVVQTEVLFMFLLSALIWRFVLLFCASDTRETPAYGGFALLGWLAGLLTLTRPIGKLLLPLLLLLLFCRSSNRRALVPQAILSLLIFCATLFPWLAVNRHSYGFWGLSQDTGLNLFHRVFDVDRTPPPDNSRFPMVDKIYRKVAVGNQVSYFKVYFGLYKRKVHFVAADRKMAGYAMEALRQHPEIFIIGTLRTFFRFFFDNRNSIHFCNLPRSKYLCDPGAKRIRLKPFPNRLDGSLFVAPKIVYWIFYLLRSINPALLSLLFLTGGCIFLSRSEMNRWAGGILLLVILYFAGLTAVFNTPEDRFVLPALPFMLMFASFALVSAAKAAQGKSG